MAAIGTAPSTGRARRVLCAALLVVVTALGGSDALRWFDIRP